MASTHMPTWDAMYAKWKALPDESKIGGVVTLTRFEQLHMFVGAMLDEGLERKVVANVIRRAADWFSSDEYMPADEVGTPIGRSEALELSRRTLEEAEARRVGPAEPLDDDD